MAGESFFGQDTTHDDQQGGIPADLIPYLEAADEVEETEAGEGTDPEAEESEREAALRALVEHSLLLGLKAAKAAIDAVPVPTSSIVSTSLELTHAERQMVADGHPVSAIKAYRDRTGVDLRTAKAAIDAAR